MPLPDPAHWKRLSSLLDTLLELDPGEREQRLVAAAGDDPALLQELRTLMAQADALESRPFLSGSADPAPQQADIGLAGQQLGAYTLLEPLGQGGSGGVWKAQRSDGRHQGFVAVKLLHLSWLGHAAAERFRREGSILARMQHPHIAALFDAGVTAGGQPYLVLEWVDGEAIDRYCRHRQLDVEARLRLFLDVLAAVGHAHRHLVVHRDIKPANVMVGADGTVKLLDFGIAKLIDAERAAADATELTQQARALTPRYAAPEQFGRETVTTATDVYALGVLLYELLVGRHPTAPADAITTEPRRLSRAATLDISETDGASTESPDMLASERATTPLKLTRRLAGDLDNILARMLRKRPEERYATVEAVADDLRRHLAHEPVQARPDSWRYRTAKFARRHRGAVAATVLTTLAIVAGVIGTISQAQRAQQQAAIAQAERDRALKGLTHAEAANAFVGFLLSEGWSRSGSVAELLARAETLVSAEFAGDAELRARMQLLVAALYADAADDKRADAMLAAAQQSAAGATDAELQAELQCTEAAFASERWDLARSRALFDRAVATLREIGGSQAEGVLASCLTQRSVVERQRGDAARALVDADASLALLARPRPGQRQAANTALLARADALSAQGRAAMAVRVYEGVLADLKASGRDRSLMAGTVWNNLAVRLQRGGQMIEARKALDASQSITRENLGARGGGATATYNLGQLLAVLGETEPARALLEEALAQAKASNNARTRANLALGAAGFFCAQGDRARCAALAAEARGILEPVLPPRHFQRAGLLANEARLAELRGDTGAAYALLQEALALEAGNPRVGADKARRLADASRLALVMSRVAEAGAHADEAEGIARAALSGFAHSYYLGLAFSAQAKVLLAQGQVEAARQRAAAALVELRATAGEAAEATRVALGVLGEIEGRR